MKYQEEFDLLQELFLKIINKYNQLENVPLKFGTDVLLHASEIHFIEVVGHNPGHNVTGLADLYGITKGAVSQLVKKLEAMGLVEKSKSPDNAKEVLISLTKKGKIAHRNHEELHQQINRSLFKEVATLSEEEIQLIMRSFKSLDNFMDEALIGIKALKEE